MILVTQGINTFSKNAYTWISIYPPATHSGGLRYHGMAPLVSHLKEINALEAKAYGQKECFEAGVNFARTEELSQLLKRPMQ